MSHSSLSVSRLVSALSHPRRRATRPARPTVKLRCEALEDRFVPTTFVQTGGVITQNADLLHRYDFDGNLNDILGGPALVASDALNQGTVAGGRYTFAANQGLQLSGGLADTASYSIELVMEFDDLEPQWKKVIDFAGLTVDNGLYLVDGNVILFPDAPPGPDAVQANTDFHVVITRDGATGVTRTYLNGVLQVVHDPGPASDGVVSPTNTLTFFHDDVVLEGTESQAGSAAYIAIYNGPLSDADVAALAQASTVANPTEVSVLEGETASMSGTFHSSNADPVTIDSPIGDIGQSSGAHGTWTWTLVTGDGSGQAQTVTITASDANGNVSTTTFDLTVNNVAPSVAADQATVTVDAGQTAVATGTLSDPGNDIASLTASVGTIVDNGDGTWSWSFPAQDESESQTVTVTVTDSDGEVATTSFDLVVVAAPPAGGSVTVVDGVLHIVGTADSDKVSIDRKGRDQVRVRADFLPEPVIVSLADVNRIVAELGEGDDCLEIAARVELPAVIHGGAGNDCLRSGGGSAVLLGDAGNDELKGGRGRDILIGGTGRDSLKGGRDDDVLIGGTTNRDQDDAALFDALAIWTSDGSFAARAAAFKALVTVFDDFEPDFLKGGDGCDLVYCGRGDVYKGKFHKRLGRK